MLLVAPYHKIGTILREFNSRNISTSRIVGIIITDDIVEAEAAATSENIESFNKNEDSNNLQDIPIVGTLDTMYEYASNNVVDEVLLYMEGAAATEVVSTFMSMGIVVHVSIRNLIEIPNATINRINGIPVVTASVNNVSTRQLMIKRLIDIFFGLIGSIVTVLLTIIIAPMMRIADPGPIFFRQERVGRNGRTFKIWKFRTMYKDAEARKAELMKHNTVSDGMMFKMDNDPRILGSGPDGTRKGIGWFIRKFSIDEFPQFFNVILGDMSLVGTRPPTLDEWEKYGSSHRARMAIRPGITGMWQTSGRSDITDFEEVIRLDMEYIRNMSVLFDIRLILKTVRDQLKGGSGAK